MTLKKYPYDQRLHSSGVLPHQQDDNTGLFLFLKRRCHGPYHPAPNGVPGPF